MYIIEYITLHIIKYIIKQCDSNENRKRYFFHAMIFLLIIEEIQTTKKFFISQNSIKSTLLKDFSIKIKVFEKKLLTDIFSCCIIVLVNDNNSNKQSKI